MEVLAILDTSFFCGEKLATRNSIFDSYWSGNTGFLWETGRRRRSAPPQQLQQQHINHAHDFEKRELLHNIFFLSFSCLSENLVKSHQQSPCCGR